MNLIYLYLQAVILPHIICLGKGYLYPNLGKLNQIVTCKPWKNKKVVIL